jgi:hypothetical protein
MVKKKEMKKLSENLTEAIEWAAAEYDLLEKFKKELEKIKSDENIDKEIRDLHKASKILHYLGKVELRANNFEKKVGVKLHDLAEEFSEYSGQKFEVANIISGLREVLNELEIERNHLIYFASSYAGSFKKNLKIAIANEKIAKKSGNYFGDEETPFIHQKALELIKNTAEQIIHAEKWVMALEATFKKAESLLTKEKTFSEAINKRLALFVIEVIDEITYQKCKWQPFEIKRMKSISKDLISFLVDLNTNIMLTIGQSDPNIIENFSLELIRLKEDLQKLIKDPSYIKDTREVKIVRSFVKELLRIAHHTKLVDLEIAKIRDGLIKLIKRKRIKFKLLKSSGDLSYEEYFGHIFHGLGRKGTKNVGKIYYLLIEILRSGFLKDFHAEGAINLNVFISLRDTYHIFRYFRPFGFVFNEKMNHILSSPIIPDEILDEIPLVFGHLQVQDQFSSKVKELLKKHGFDYEGKTRGWFCALTNAKAFRTVFSKKMLDIKDKWNLTKERKKRGFKLPEIDCEYGFRGYYIDKDKKLKALAVTPDMIKELILYLPKVEDEEYYNFLEQLTGKNRSEW